MMPDKEETKQELSPRQREILSIVVREYITTAQPVGSLAVCQRHPLGVSPATIRNEFAFLEEAGYLAQPHTSAGRVPTEKGYRYFVAQLMEEAELPLAEQFMLRHQFHQVRMDLDQWMRLTAAALAHTAQAASLVTAPHTPQARIKHIKLVSVSENMGLIVLVLYGGTLRQDMIPLDASVTQEEMEMVANKLNTLFQGMNAIEMANSHHELGALEQEVLSHLLSMMWNEEKKRSMTLYRDGLLNVLQQPEFAEGDKARHIVEMLEGRGLLESVLLEASEQNGVQVIIGGEGRWEDMEDYSMVLARYGVVGQSSGALGIVGPLRMPYRRAVSAVRYISQLLSELIGDLYGTERPAERSTTENQGGGGER